MQKEVSVTYGGLLYILFWLQALKLYLSTFICVPVFDSTEAHHFHLSDEGCFDCKQKDKNLICLTKGYIFKRNEEEIKCI